jgi:hypothetical protein
MPIDAILTRRLQLSLPVIQAPLAGGGDTPASTRTTPPLQRAVGWKD